MTQGGSVKPKGTFFELEGDHVRRYVWAEKFIGGMKVLDAGCGHGYGSAYLADGTAREIVGIDSDRKAIRFASETYQNPKLHFEVMDVSRLMFQPESFDAVISFEVIEHLVDTTPYLREIKRVLKTDGLFLLSTPNKRFHERFSRDGKPLSRFHVHEYYPQELYSLLEDYFSITGIYYLFGKHDEALLGYMHSCSVPKWIRRFVPLFLKDAWLRMRGIPSMSKDVRGRWQDFEIAEVDRLEGIGPDRAIQLFRCEKKMNDNRQTESC